MMLTRFFRIHYIIIKDALIIKGRTLCILVLELGILPFRVIAALIELYFIIFKDGAASGMGDALQSGISRFLAAGLDVLLWWTPMVWAISALDIIPFCMLPPAIYTYAHIFRPPAAALHAYPVP